MGSSMKPGLELVTECCWLRTSGVAPDCRCRQILLFPFGDLMKDYERWCVGCGKDFKKGDRVLIAGSTLPDGYPADIESFCSKKCFEEYRVSIYSYSTHWKVVE